MASVTSIPTERQEAIEAVRAAREGIFEGEDLTVDQLEVYDRATDLAKEMGITDRELGYWPPTSQYDREVQERKDYALDRETDRSRGIDEDRGLGYGLER